ncbi:OmpA family protein [Paracoccaceae bacterium]|nr:OmpA family protein [Paracoccaceae bacterium]
MKMGKQAVRTFFILSSLLLAYPAWSSSLTSNLISFECGPANESIPIILRKTSDSWKTVSVYGDEPVEVLAPDVNTFVFPQVNFVQQFLKFKDGRWSLLEVDKGEVETLKCEEKSKLVDIVAEAIAPLISDEITPLRLMQDELVSGYTALQQRHEKLEQESDEQLLKAKRQTAALNRQAIALRQQLAKVSDLLEISEEKDIESQAQLQNLGNRLNAALARAASEQRRRLKLEEAERDLLAGQAEGLTKYKSEFFASLRILLADQIGVRIVGDRFVFSSEVLFAPGAAELSRLGQSEIVKVGSILNKFMSEVPGDIDWIIRVDGHTDDQPLSGTGEFKDNWELSQARALSVVKFLISQLNIPADRLAANGFAEFQPVNTANTVQARSQNRRIELKLSER